MVSSVPPRQPVAEDKSLAAEWRRLEQFPWLFVHCTSAPIDECRPGKLGKPTGQKSKIKVYMYGILTLASVALITC